MPSEFALIARYFRRPRDAQAAGVVLGVDDDAALLAPTPGMQLAVCTDTLVAGVHFPVDTPAHDIGWKSLAVNLSDLAAMGAMPRACLLALTLPVADEAWVAEFARGFFALADTHGCALIGGDTTAGPLSVTVTALGEVPAGSALTRGGARAGDLVCISGTPGVAALGLARWQAGVRADDDVALTSLLRPVPRLALGLALRGIATACIDVSDGLLGDLAHVLDVSSAATGIPLGATIDISALPRSPALAALPESVAREYLLGGGDDYELLFTLPPSSRALLPSLSEQGGVPVAVIGRITGDGRLRCLDAEGTEWQPTRHSWEHFRS